LVTDNENLELTNIIIQKLLKVKPFPVGTVLKW